MSWDKGKAQQVIRPKTCSSEDPTEQIETIKSGTSSSLTQHNRYDHHKWTDHMEAFAEEFKNFLDLDKHQSDGRLKPITVALLGGGVDKTNRELEDVTKDGRTFSDRKIDNLRLPVPSPYWESTTEHGTLMARSVRLIRRVSPSACIYSIKVGATSTYLKRSDVLWSGLRPGRHCVCELIAAAPNAKRGTCTT